MTRPPWRVIYEKPDRPAVEMRYSLDVYDARGNWVEKLGELGIDPGGRAQTLSVAAFVTIANRVGQRRT